MSLLHLNPQFHLPQQQLSQQQQQQDRPRKTRRRLRVSCVECTRRRQKCDRKQPCGLCKNRGVEHLCRWETEPYARPPPARPPGTGRAGTRRNQQGQQQQQQQQRPLNAVDGMITTIIRSPSLSVSPTTSFLDSPASQILLPQHGGFSLPPSPSQALLAGTISRTSPSPPGRPNEELRRAALALADMRLSEEDRRLGEGSLACALQEFTDSAAAARIYELPLAAFPQSSYAVIRPSDSFIPRLPDKAHCVHLLNGYIEHVNWSIGIPDKVLFLHHEAMWAQLVADPSNIRRFRPSLFALLFAIFAFSPNCQTEEESRDYFNQALAARKVEEDKYASLDAPSPAKDFESAVFTCLATAFLARYLQDRGRVTEAWRVVGSGLRDAQNAGLHRFLAPGKAKNLTTDQRTFMLVGWHLCVEFDRYLSLFLGRPTVVRARDCNVQLPIVSSDLALDGSTNTALVFQYYFISLTRRVSEAKERFLSEIPDPEDGHAYFNNLMTEWLASLPSYYKLDRPPDTSYEDIYPKLFYQRLTLNSYYSSSSLLYHRALAYTKPAQTEDAVAINYGVQQQLAWDQSQLAQYAINMLHSQNDLMMNQYWERQVPFDISMYMFEAAVTLGVTLLRFSLHPYALEWQRELAQAIGVLESLRKKDYGKIVAQAIQVLRVLQDLCDDAIRNGAKSGANGYAANGMGGSGSGYDGRSFDPAAMQEEAKLFFEREAFDRDDHSYHTSDADGAGMDPSMLLRNLWFQHSQQPMEGMAALDLSQSSAHGPAPASVPEPAAPPVHVHVPVHTSATSPTTPISAGPSTYSGFSPIESPYTSYNAHTHSGSFSMWSPDGFPSNIEFGVNHVSPVNVQY